MREKRFGGEEREVWRKREFWPRDSFFAVGHGTWDPRVVFPVVNT